MADAQLTFYSSIRQGAALAITRTDVVNPGPGVIARVQLPVTLGYQATASEKSPTAGTTLSLLGPGDIVGLDTRTIVRSFPQPNDNNAEAGFLVYIDFDQVDLPWRYTPATNVGSIGSSTDQLRPWMTLVVLEEGADFNPQSDFRPAQGDEKLPQLSTTSDKLPALDQVWAWAHVQAQQFVSDTDLPKQIGGPPGALVARLLSARHLESNKAYTAFLVPTFEAGVLAAQGQDTSTTDGLSPAWPINASTPGPVQLPVYYSWRFQTGNVSSFQQAISELAPLAQLPSSVGLRDMDVSDPGLIPASATGGAMPMSMGGALQTPEQAGISDPQLDTTWLNDLGALVDPALQTSPQLVPPLYGRWYGVQDHLDYPKRGTGTNPPWFSLLNQDPRYRVAAGLGTEVVQRDQQALLAAAQEQESALVNTVNRRRKVMQTGREVFTSLMNRHLKGATTPLIYEEILLVTAFLHGKILSCTGTGPTIRPIITGSPFGPGGVPIPFRRPFRTPPFGPIIRTINTGGYNPKPNTPPNTSTPGPTVGPSVPGGLPDPGVTTVVNTMSSDQRLYWGVVVFWVARKLLSTQGGKYWWLLRRLLRLGLDLIQMASSQGVTDLAVLQKLRDGTLLGTDILGIPPVSNFISAPQIPEPVLSDPTTWPQPRQPSTGADDAAAQAFRTAAAALFDFVNGAPKPGRQIPALDIPGTVTCILNALTPAVTFVAYEEFIHVQTKTRTIEWQGADPLEQILMPPIVSFPMWQRLSAISADWILPNVGDVPRNSVSLLETNQKFIESFMVGLNHEVNRELIWNGYPTDQRGTIFQQFWDPSGWTDGDGTGANLTDADFLDITDIRGWGPTSALGTHTQRAKAAQVVLLVRGDVIKRYPNVIVYAAKAVPDSTQQNGIGIDDTHQRYPVFQAILTGDVAYYGFDLSLDEARGINGDLGYYFILQEHPSEPKFTDPVPPTATGPMNVGPGNFAGPPATAAILAQTAFEPPIRAAILGSELLPSS